MGVTFSSATLQKTIVYAGEALHPRSGYVHVLGYQNQAENRASHPNALILPLPSKTQMGPENVIATSDYSNVLVDMARVATATIRGTALPTGPIQVFQVGGYVVVMAQRAEQLAEAVQILPPFLQPKLNQEIVDAYSRWYPDWPLAVCAWEGRIKANPLFWWYEPLDPKNLFLPALTAQDGKVPNLRADVKRDLKLLIGSTIHPFGVPRSSQETLGGLLPSQIWGQLVEGEDFNRDYTVAVEPLRQIMNFQGRLDPKIWEIEFESYNPAAGSARTPSVGLGEMPGG